MRIGLAIALCAALAACSSNSGIVQDGPDAYRIAVVGGTGFANSGAMQEKTYADATAFCSEKGKVVETIDSESKQAKAFGGFPEASLRFRCVDRKETK